MTIKDWIGVSFMIAFVVGGFGIVFMWAGGFRPSNIYLTGWVLCAVIGYAIITRKR